MIEEIRARYEAATPGPWTPQDYDHDPGDEGVPVIGGGEVGSMSGHLVAYALTLSDESQSLADGRFIAGARTDVGLLLDALEAALSLHQPHTWTEYNVPCFDEYDEPTRVHNGCICGSQVYPCTTVRAITSALEGTSNEV